MVFDFNNYVSDRYIGEGYSGCVYLYRNKYDDNDVIVGKNSSTLEIDAMMASRCKHVVKCLGTQTLDECTRIVFMEYCNRGDVFDMFARQSHSVAEKIMSLDEVWCCNLEIFQQLCEGVKHMHACGVVHYDIKPENVFITKDLVVKLGDFGLATTKGRRCSNVIGTVGCMAPEVLGKRSHGVEADVWSMGVMLYQLLHFGMLPFGKPETEEALLAQRAHMWIRIDVSIRFPAVGDLLVRMLNVDPSKRITMDAVAKAVSGIVKAAAVAVDVDV